MLRGSAPVLADWLGLALLPELALVVIQGMVLLATAMVNLFLPEA